MVYCTYSVGYSWGGGGAWSGPLEGETEAKIQFLCKDILLVDLLVVGEDGGGGGGGEGGAMARLEWERGKKLTLTLPTCESFVLLHVKEPS